VTRQGYNIDLKLMAETDGAERTQDLGRMDVNTPTGGLVQVESVAPPSLVGSATQINHIERQRAITLRIYPPEKMPLQEAMDRLQNQVVAPLLASGEIQPPYDVRLSGTADDLTQTYLALRGNFILALAITYLLMSALFGSFLYPLIIMFAVPLAAAGGFAGLWAVNQLLTYQPLDVLTMLGFIILVGIVVNNAILIVYQALNNIREGGMQHKEAVVEATKVRLRPIYMSTTTSVLGMSPLVLWPGPGSELYRGLGSVVLGGLALSTLFTVFMIPSLLMFFIRWEKIPEQAGSGDTAPAGDA
jgi:HAE1 family hydrophobic/amphiphilic exporter-1